MCEGCNVADLLNDFADAGAIERDHRRMYAEFYLDDPSWTADLLARRAELAGRRDLAARARQANRHLEQLHREFAFTFPGGLD
jgi:hypothetical protein